MPRVSGILLTSLFVDDLAGAVAVLPRLIPTARETDSWKVRQRIENTSFFPI